MRAHRWLFIEHEAAERLGLFAAGAAGMEASRETRTDNPVDAGELDACLGRAGGGARLPDAEEGGAGMASSSTSGACG